MFKPLMVGSQLSELRVTPMPASPRGSGNLPANRSTTEKPPLVDFAADYDIPKLWRDRDVNGRPRSIARELTPGERARVERRHRELQIGCSPFTPSEEDRVITALSEMLGGFRSLQRQCDEAAVAALTILRRLVAEFPVWAIEEACEALSRGKAMLDGKRINHDFAPNDSQVYGVIGEILAPYEKLRVRAAALLIAPVRTKDPR
jgi:hypothetical protein